MTDSRTACWAALLLMACDEPAPAPSGRGRCDLSWGTVLTPAKSDALLVEYDGPEPSLIESEPGGAPEAPMLLVSPDRVVTAGGSSKTCNIDGAAYVCNGGGSFREVVVTLGKLESKVENECNWDEDPQDIRLTAADCIPEGTVVVEGDLHDYDPTRPPPMVKLQGPKQFLKSTTGAPGGEEDHSYAVAIPCEVRGGHYTCPTIGYLNSATHAVVAGSVASEVELPVTNCVPSKVELDVECPAIPVGFVVRAPSTNNYTITASYEGGEPDACRRRMPGEIPGTPAAKEVYTSDYICPPAPGDERGRGTYHIKAVYSSFRPLEIDASDVFDGCNGSRSVVMLER
jgi:hypothetical protein